ncbi:MAG: hypothetical protein ACXABY_18245 [Candidatus Thorarchaeota archaeon]
MTDKIACPNCEMIGSDCRNKLIANYASMDIHQWIGSGYDINNYLNGMDRVAELFELVEAAIDKADKERSAFHS